MGTIKKAFLSWSLDMIYKSAILYLRLAFAHALNDWFNITPVQLITCGTRLPICGCFIQQTNRLLAVLVLLIFAVNKHNIRELSTLTGIVLTMKGLEQAWGVRTPISETQDMGRLELSSNSRCSQAFQRGCRIQMAFWYLPIAQWDESKGGARGSGDCVLR